MMENFQSACKKINMGKSHCSRPQTWMLPQLATSYDLLTPIQGPTEGQEYSHMVSLSVFFRAVVQCVLQFNFRAARYSGIIALQEALIVKKMLHTMEAKAEYISSGDGKFLM